MTEPIGEPPPLSQAQINLHDEIFRYVACHGRACLLLAIAAIFWQCAYAFQQAEWMNLAALIVGAVLSCFSVYSFWTYRINKAKAMRALESHVQDQMTAKLHRQSQLVDSSDYAGAHSFYDIRLLPIREVVQEQFDSFCCQLSFVERASRVAVFLAVMWSLHAFVDGPWTPSEHTKMVWLIAGVAGIVYLLNQVSNTSNRASKYLFAFFYQLRFDSFLEKRVISIRQHVAN